MGGEYYADEGHDDKAFFWDGFEFLSEIVIHQYKGEDDERGEE